MFIFPDRLSTPSTTSPPTTVAAATTEEETTLPPTTEAAAVRPSGGGERKIIINLKDIYRCPATGPSQHFCSVVLLKFFRTGKIVNSVNWSFIRAWEIVNSPSGLAFLS
jgi:hypothetical protein